MCADGGAWPGLERRQAERFPLAIEIGLDGGTGRTRDLNRAGVFFTTAMNVSVGAELAFEVEGRHLQVASPLLVRCRGRVVRVEALGARRGVAVAFDSIQFLAPRGGPE